MRALRHAGSTLQRVIVALLRAEPAFDKRIRGFAMHDAVLTGVETRTSSPLRITRGEDGHSRNTRGVCWAGANPRQAEAGSLIMVTAEAATP
ncbi:hypothetical protein [Thermomonas sp.]|uniref:hypothetical protein n=1 Tax=Thermomonas sp. TaxID=1971895 RepID=UPI0035B28D48